MSEQDPYDALSAAMREKALRRPVPRPRPKNSRTSLLVMLFAGLGILAVGIPVGILLTLRVLAMPSEPPEKHVIVIEQHPPAPMPHPPGEMFKKVPTDGATSGPGKAAATENAPPPDPP